MSKLPHVFSDASIRPNYVILGVYSEHLNITKSIKIHKQLSTSQAEELALKLAMKLTQGINCHYFVDNQQLAVKYSGIAYWIPREFNKQADSLTKVEGTPLGVTSVQDFIRANYSLKSKLKLIHKLLNFKTTRTIQQLIQHKQACSLLNAMLTRAERPDNCRTLIAKAKPLKQSDLVRLIRTYKPLIQNH